MIDRSRCVCVCVCGWHHNHHQIYIDIVDEQGDDDDDDFQYFAIWSPSLFLSLSPLTFSRHHHHCIQFVMELLFFFEHNDISVLCTLTAFAFITFRSSSSSTSVDRFCLFWFFFFFGFVSFIHNNDNNRCGLVIIIVIITSIYTHIQNKRINCLWSFFESFLIVDVDAVFVLFVGNFFYHHHHRLCNQIDDDDKLPLVCVSCVRNVPEKKKWNEMQFSEYMSHTHWVDTFFRCLWIVNV